MKRKAYSILIVTAVLACISAAETFALPLQAHSVEVCIQDFPARDTVQQSLVHAVVTGRVTDSGTGEPVPGANVMLQTADGRATVSSTASGPIPSG